jgi:DMSO/TMAO reductase YedYZ molybdopterin-dependent catalytic subunit
MRWPEAPRPLAAAQSRAVANPLRDERVAAWLGTALGVLFTTCFITGLYSHVQQHPLSWLPIPAAPAGLYRVTQGVHVVAGVASLPILIAKLWVVWPRLFAWPPFRTLGDVIERLGLVGLVGGGVFMVFTGVANIFQWYPWPFSFTAAHYEVAWITMGAIVAHVGAKGAIARRSFRRTPAVVAPAVVTPARPTGGLTRRGFITAAAAASGLLTVTTVGETVPGLAPAALLAPRDPRQRPINRSAANAGVIRRATSPGYRLIVAGDVDHPFSLTAADLDDPASFPRHDSVLPISCVEGWSYSAHWTGIRVRDLLAAAGAPPPAKLTAVHIESLEEHSPYRVSSLDRYQIAAGNTLLATHLEGDRLSLDHGFPLRLIAPNRPGVLQTKWVTRLVVVR